ncbi:MAG: hypothetical protein JRL30_08155 [Deltaproteobacteria bacterium]|nr:hypothetical protein [Deltaproteobacteria bacterium]
MKCIRLEDMGIDICVTVNVKVIDMQKEERELTEEMERLELLRVLKHIGTRHEPIVAQEIVREFKESRE